MNIVDAISAVRINAIKLQAFGLPAALLCFSNAWGPPAVCAGAGSAGNMTDLKKWFALAAYGNAAVVNMPAVGMGIRERRS